MQQENKNEKKGRPNKIFDILVIKKKTAFSLKKIIAYVSSGVGVVLLIAMTIFMYFYIFKDLPDPRGLKNYGVIPLSSQIYDRNGTFLYEFYREENRTPVKLKDLPKYVSQSTIAIEDADFYKHGGISIFGGIMRALKDSVILGKSKQGGSTITQQLVKSALLTPERTVRRKLKEVVLAIQIEQMLSKDEILELYLNQVPYGGVSYGIQEASKMYFDKDAKELTLEEAAMLAGLPRAPSVYNPYTNYEKAKARQKEVLKRMYDLGYITGEQRKQADKVVLTIRPPHTPIKAPHFVFYVRSILEKEYGTKIVEEGGLEVITTLDYDIHASAEAILREEVDKVKKMKVTNGALLVTRPSTGEILSMVGSTDFFATGSGTFNVTTALRQPGSSIKPINYAIGIDRKIVSPASVFIDAPSCFVAAGQPKAYCPVNYDGTYRGPVQLRFALGNSLNIPAVKMLAKNTVEDFVASSSGFLIKSFKNPKHYGLSLTLGGGELTMIEMAQAFSAFANEGTPRELVSILKVTDKNGKVLYEYKDPNVVQNVKEPLQYPNFLAIQGKRAISSETAFLISHILLDNNARSAVFGTSSNLVIPKKDVSVKTGTTNDFRDNWTIGYTPNFLSVVWVGNNDNSRMSYLASGITGAAPIWNKVMRVVLENQPNLFPRKPADVVGKSVCTTYGSVQEGQPQEGQTACQTRFEYFIKGTENVGLGYATKEMIPINKDTSVYSPKAKPEELPSIEMQEKTMLWDGLSKYCLDCVHEGEGHTTVMVGAGGAAVTGPAR